MNSIYQSPVAAELLAILRDSKLSVQFQPIVNPRKQKIYGYEGLIRGPSNSILHSPEKLFDAAIKLGHLTELDYLCREVVIRQFKKLALPGKLFININPVTILSRNHIEGETLSYVKQAGLTAKEVVIEITETSPIEDFSLIKKAINHYRNSGFSIAIDDLGTGYSGLKLWSEMQPDFVKIDRHFINTINKDNIKRHFVRSIIEIADSLNCKVIAEGVETTEEYATVRKLGAKYIQGYYFSRPESLPGKTVPAYLFRNHPRHNQPGSVRLIKELLQDIVEVHPSLSLGDTADLFKQFPMEDSFAVSENHSPLGIITRLKVFDVLSSRFGRSLFAHKPICQFMNKNILIADAEMPLETLSQRLTSSLDVYVDEFLIVENDKMIGKGTLIDLLKKITELRVESARHANPLTLLPGNIPIQKTLQKYLDENRRFCVAYCDLDNFKPYNDYYGYSKGDEALKLLSRLFKKHIPEEEGFIGHIGGDDFILVFNNEHWLERCKSILAELSHELVHLYTKSDIQQGYIKARDRTGQTRKFPLMSMSIGALKVYPDQQPAIHELNDFASKAKSAAKKAEGNSICHADIIRHQLTPFVTVQV